jgi:tetratricopeptide (TPR) repeat protein
MTLDEANKLFLEANTDYTNKDYNSALEKYIKVLSYTPDNLVVLHNYALTLISLHRFVDGINALEKPILSGYTESYLSRGAAYRSLGRYTEAINDFANCFIKDPNNAKAYSNYGNSLREFGLPAQSIPFLNKALELNPTDTTFRLNESVAHLLNGDLINGWKNYDARWYYQSDTCFKPQLPGIEYDGTQNIEGKIVCVYSEQGFGDSIQFIRYVKLLQSMGAKIILVTRPQLVNLFEYNFPDIDIRTEYSDLVYHYHVPLLELPKCFNTDINSIPYPEPYLSISKNLIDKYKKQLGEKTKKRIGVVWSSNSIAFITKFRQVPLESLLETITDNDHEIVNVEYDVSTEEQETLDKYNVKSVVQGGFEDTAALIKTLDVLVTVDTVYAHLAGALGVKTFVMLADYGMDWRWFLKRKDSPFYNSVRLFRQKGDSDWLAVFTDIKNTIKNSV